MKYHVFTGIVAALSCVPSVSAVNCFGFGKKKCSPSTEKPSEQISTQQEEPDSVMGLPSRVSFVSLSRLAFDLEEITMRSPDGNRYTHSQGHENALNWIASTLEPFKDYYDVIKQEISVPTMTATMKIGTNPVIVKPLVTIPIAKSPQTTIIKAKAIQKIPNYGCDSSDYTNLNAKDKAVLVSQGGCTLAEKNLLAGKAGAATIIIYNDIEEPRLDGNLGEYNDKFIPGFVIANHEVSDFLGNSGEGKHEIQPETMPWAFYHSMLKEKPTWNLIVETKNGNKDNVIVAGAHLDSAEVGPGMNDNGSGAVALLETAINLAEFPTTNAVRFIWFTGKEQGLYGSKKYLESLTAEDKGRIALFLNFEMLASPNFVFGVFDGDGSASNISGTPGSGPIKKLFQEYFRQKIRHNITSILIPLDSSFDYAPFADEGIAIGGLFAGGRGIKTPAEAIRFGDAGEPYDPNNHRDTDMVHNMDFWAFYDNTKAAAHAIATYALSIDSLSLGWRGWRMQERSTWKSKKLRKEKEEEEGKKGKAAQETGQCSDPNQSNQDCANSKRLDRSRRIISSEDRHKNKFWEVMR